MEWSGVDEGPQAKPEGELDELDGTAGFRYYIITWFYYVLLS
jgi:hypothetical protein